MWHFEILNLKCQESTHLCLPRPKVTDTCHLPRFYTGPGELNSGPHVYTASSLLTKNPLFSLEGASHKVFKSSLNFPYNVSCLIFLRVTILISCLSHCDLALPPCHYISSLLGFEQFFNFSCPQCHAIRCLEDLKLDFEIACVVLSARCLLYPHSLDRRLVQKGLPKVGERAVMEKGWKRTQNSFVSLWLLFLNLETMRMWVISTWVIYHSSY